MSSYLWDELICGNCGKHVGWQFDAEYPAGGVRCDECAEKEKNEN